MKPKKNNKTQKKTIKPKKKKTAVFFLNPGFFPTLILPDIYIYIYMGLSSLHGHEITRNVFI